ncbi:eukaryotic translation initiation factor 3 subunit F-like [Musa acuminata AAA Group]|uniref:eukaryotic translation initiation factor 3 subunit F n=1 Tax=Musa acuminata AAA Group TaxID=214697 RepID=UPI0031D81442
MAVLQFFPPSSPVVSARLHPVVLFSICDCYVRRPDQADRVIGTLLGTVSGGVVEIKNSYAVPHNESADQVALDVEYHRNMYMSHLKVNPKEVLVGWYSTGFGVSGGSALIHDFYVKELKDSTKDIREAQNSVPPVHLTVDTVFSNGEASIKAYMSVNLSLGDRSLAAQFQEIPLDLRMIEAERVGFDIFKKTAVDKLPNDLEGMEASMERLYALIDDAYKYVDDVVEGRVNPDNDIGRFLSDTLASVPKMSPIAFDKVFNDRVQDNLALVYLSSLIRAQLGIAEKLNTAAQVL